MARTGTLANLRPTATQLVLLARLYDNHGHTTFSAGKGQTATQLGRLVTKGLVIEDNGTYRLAVSGAVTASMRPGQPNHDVTTMVGYHNIDRLNTADQRCDYHIKAARYGAATTELTNQLKANAWHARVRKAAIARVRRGY